MKWECLLYDKEGVLAFSSGYYIQLMRFLGRTNIKSMHCLISRARHGKLKHTFDKYGNKYKIVIKELNNE